MPLRVAEQDGYIHAVNGCYDCPFVESIKNDNRVGPFFACGKQGEWKGKEVRGISIPVWCPLPREEVKMRGKHPENIVWDDERPIVFIVEDAEIDSHGMSVTIKPEFPQGPDWSYLRKGDGIVAHHDKDSCGYGVMETPMSSKIRISSGLSLKKGDRLTALGPIVGKRE